MNQTNQKLIFIVIGAAVCMACSFVFTVEWLLFHPVTPLNDKVFTAVLAVGNSVLSFMFGVLVNTRTAPPSSTTESTVTTTTTPDPKPPDEPVPVQVVNQPSDPVPTEEATKNVS